MTIVVSTHGFPKSGTHALAKACQLLGVPCDVDHRPHATGLPTDATHSVFIKRDPRNLIVAKLRDPGSRQSVTPGTFLATFRRFQTASLRRELAAFEAWQTDPRVLCVRYENLVASPLTLEDIARHLGIDWPVVEVHKAWQRLPGFTRTWNAEPSDYRAVWNDVVDRAWRHEGGPELLARWGY